MGERNLATRGRGMIGGAQRNMTPDIYVSYRHINRFCKTHDRPTQCVDICDYNAGLVITRIQAQKT